ncbi:FMN-binding domain-containing protein [Micromonospora haikouensis]|uniref:FMN-binding domain-containing protein n=1 Tax=Micromonospora haikouensis TaxID=686309 RepID=A0A1C4VKR3_9ACTN|nr:FMN-binding protein [Micromonospora haikouensis]SCE84604.1 FMN-binding domain-containing protein [Micromonospora haikouensis]
MRRITVWLLSTVAALVLLFSYKTSTMGVGGESSAIAAGTGGDAGTGSSGTGAGRYDGSVAQTRWGPVQVRITVSAGKITDVTALQMPDGNHRDQQINDYAVPILRQSALAAQSADIDTVSGATVTSDGYRESLQAAIDAAHL